MYVFTLDSSVGVITCMTVTLVEENIRELDSGHTHILFRNVCARAHTIFHAHRNICALAHTIFCARGIRAQTYSIFRALASARILACTYTCIYVHARASVSICACDPTSIHACGLCSSCLSVVLPNTILWGELGQVSRTAHVYIWGDLRDCLYHSP